MPPLNSSARVPVLIAGAGPTGLVLALWLKKKGVKFRIIDSSPEPGKTSRALAVQARTLEFYRQLGIAEALIKAGITAYEITMRRRGKVVARAKLGAMGKDMSPFPYLLFCSQDVHEGILCEILSQMGVEIERPKEILEFSQDENGVLATVRGPQGEEKITADYLVGCDGAHSTVRHGLGVAFPGGTYSQIFFVADVMAAGEMASGGLQVSLSPKDFCLVMPIQTKGTVRLTGLVPPEAEIKQRITFEDVAPAVGENTGIKVEKLNWFSSYHVHHRVAEQFRVGRVFLAGDAGHIHSPAGGQGMNTGIGDAINLAWKLAEVVQGRFSEKLLASYEPERIAFARVLVKTTDTAFRLIANTSPVGAVFRTYVLPAFFATAVRSPAFVRFAFKTISQIRIKYRASFLSQGSAGEVHAGDRLPWVANSQGDNFETLKSLDWQVHVYGKVNDEFRTGLNGLTVHEVEWNTDAESKGLLRDAFYLLRPDGHVAVAAPVQDAMIVNDYFKRLGRK